jgi:ribonuclease HI
VNTDGSFSSGDGSGGGGVVLRDHHSDFIVGDCRFFPAVSDPEGAELRACRLALSVAKDAGARKLILESECQSLVSKLGSLELDRSVHGPMVEEIKFLLSEFEEAKVRFVRRSANRVADSLGKEGCRNKVCNTWMGVPPEFIVNLLDTDCAG